MKNILFVVRGFTPEQSASGNLLLPLINALELRYNVHVLTLTENNLSSSGNIFRIKNRNDNGIKNLCNKIKRQISVGYFNDELKITIEREIERLDLINNYDAIIAVTYEEMLALINSDIDKQKKNVFILEKLPETSKLPLIKKMQSRVNKKKLLDMVSNVNNSFALPIVYSVIAPMNVKNTYQLEHPMVRNLVKFKENNNNPFKMLYAGGLDKKQRNPTPVIEFLNKINKIENILVDFYSYGNCQILLNDLKFDFLSCHSVVPISELYDLYHASDFLITIGNKETDIFPSKLFDCLSMGIPIIHFAQNNDDPYFKYLENYKFAIIILYDELGCIETIDKFFDFKRLVKNENITFEYIQEHFDYCTPEYNAKILEDVIFNYG